MKCDIFVWSFWMNQRLETHLMGPILLHATCRLKSAKNYKIEPKQHKICVFDYYRYFLKPIIPYPLFQPKGTQQVGFHPSQICYVWFEKELLFVQLCIISDMWVALKLANILLIICCVVLWLWFAQIVVDISLSSKKN